MKLALKTLTIAVFALILSLASGFSAGAAPGLSLEGQWLGSVNWGRAGTFPATVQITQSSPLQGTIDVAGVCQADWSEADREGNRLRVYAKVTSATTDCRNGHWDLTVDETRMSGPGVEFPDQSITLQRASGSTSALCADQRAELFDAVPPGLEAGAGILLNRIQGLPKWVGSTLAIAGCIPQALDANPDGGYPDLWKNINSQEFIQAVCRTAEAAFDPLGLGYTKNFFCGAPVS